MVNRITTCAVTLIAAILLAGPLIPSWASTRQNSGPVFKPLTPEVAAKLPSWLKPSDVAGMTDAIPGTSVGSSQRTDLAVMDSREKAQMLLHKVGSHIRHAKRSSFYSPQADTEYRAGLRAFDEGDFAKAINHLQTADEYVAGIPNERVIVG